MPFQEYDSTFEKFQIDCQRSKTRSSPRNRKESNISFEQDKKKNHDEKKAGEERRISKKTKVMPTLPKAIRKDPLAESYKEWVTAKCTLLNVEKRLSKKQFPFNM